MKMEPAMTPEEALQLLEEATGHLQMDRASHLRVIRAVGVLVAALGLNSSPTEAPPPAGEA